MGCKIRKNEKGSASPELAGIFFVILFVAGAIAEFGWNVTAPFTIVGYATGGTDLITISSSIEPETGTYFFLPPKPNKPCESDTNAIQHSEDKDCPSH